MSRILHSCLKQLADDVCPRQQLTILSCDQGGSAQNPACSLYHHRLLPLRRHVPADAEVAESDCRRLELPYRTVIPTL